MKIIIRCFGQSSGFGDPMTCDCDYAVLDVTPELICCLRRRIRIAEQAKAEDAMFSHISFTDYSLDVYAYDLYEAIEAASADLSMEVDEAGWAVLPEEFDLTATFEKQRTDCDSMDVCAPREAAFNSAYIGWSFAPKHAGVEVHTATITLHELIEALSVEGIVA